MFFPHPLELPGHLGYDLEPFEMIGNLSDMIRNARDMI